MSISNKSVLSNLIWRYAERFLSVFITFLVSLILARLLSPKEYGTVALLSVIISLLEVFCTRGYNQALVQKKQINNIDYNTAFWINFIIELILYVIVFFTSTFIASYFGDLSLASMLRILALRLLIAGVNSIQQAYAQRNMLFRKFFFSTLFGTLLSGVIGITLAYLGFGAWALVIQSLINPFVDTIVLFFTLDWHPSFEFSFFSFKEMTPFGIRMSMMGLLDSLYGNIRSFIIGKRYSPSDLAYYNRGQSLPSLVINNTQTAASNVFFSALARENSVYDVKEKMRTYTRVMFFVLCPMMFGMACVSKELINVLFSSKWNPAVPYLIIHCFVYLTYVPIMPINQSLIAIRKEKLLLFISIFHRTLGIIILMIILNKGPFFIALSSVIIDYIVFFISYYAAIKFLDYKISEIYYDIWKTLLSTLVMCLIILFENVFYYSYNTILILIVKIITGIIVYILMSIILKNKEFIKIFELLKQKLKL